MKESRIIENEIGLTSYAFRNTSLLENYFSKNLKMQTFFTLSVDDNIIQDKLGQEDHWKIILE